MFSIRKATSNDILLIRELTFKVWPQTYSAIIAPEQIDHMLDMMYSESSLQKQMSDGCQFIFVYDESVPVGFSSYQEIRPGKFKLHKLYVLPSQQGKGTGKFILDYIIDEIKKADGTSIELQVHRNNKARAFYEKLGFAIMYQADFDIGNGFFMTDYVMEKKIS